MRLLVTGAFGYRPKQIEALKSLGIELFFLQHEQEAMTVIAPEEVDAVVCNGLFLYHDIERFTQLRYIQLTSAGLDRVPAQAINNPDIVLHNAKGVYAIPMAEWAVCKVLDIYKATAGFQATQQARAWEKGTQAARGDGTKIAIIGAGNVGSEVAKRFQVFGAEIVGFDIHTHPVEGFDRIRLIDELPGLVTEFDTLILTAPLTEQTYHLIGYDLLSDMKQGAILINIARGALIDEKAMYKILKERNDIHAALDVFEKEPLPADNPLWKLPNVTVSPHNSFVSAGNNERMFAVIYENLKKFIEKQ